MVALDLILVISIKNGGLMATVRSVSWKNSHWLGANSDFAFDYFNLASIWEVLYQGSHVRETTYPR